MTTVIISRSPLIRAGIRTMIEQGSLCVEKDNFDADKLEQYSEVKSVFIGSSGFEIESIESNLSTIKRMYPDCRFIYIEEDANEIRRLKFVSLIRSGFSSCLTIFSSLESVQLCIKSVDQKKNYVAPEIVDLIISELTEDLFNGTDATPDSNLTTNELKTAILIAQGKSIGIIAKEVGRHMSTISTTKKRIMNKTKSGSIISLHNYLVRNNFIKK